MGLFWGGFPVSTFINLVGKRYGRLVVLLLAPKLSPGDVIRWLCLCDCGNEAVVSRLELRSGDTKSCGCLGSESKKTIALKHGHTRNGHSPEYRAWYAMRRRCSEKKNVGYANYGGRGISFAKRWEIFENFFADMGPKPSASHSLDRIDNDGNYEPGNCRWATKNEQMRKTRRSLLVEYNGQKIPLAELAQRVGIKYKTLLQRLYRNQPILKQGESHV